MEFVKVPASVYFDKDLQIQLLTVVEYGFLPRCDTTGTMTQMDKQHR